MHGDGEDKESRPHRLLSLEKQLNIELKVGRAIKLRTYGNCLKILNPIVSDKMAYANSVDPDQTAPKGQYRP